MALFNGVVETYGEVLRVQIYQEGANHYAYISDALADDVDSAEEFASSYNDVLWDSLTDYKAGTHPRSIYDFWPREEDEDDEED